MSKNNRKKINTNSLFRKKTQHKECNRIHKKEELEHRIILYENRNEYEGYVRISDGKRNGHGTYRNNKNHTVYVGNFVNDKCEGFGIKEYIKTGDRHEGNYLNNKRDGWGKYTWRNHNEYIGMFKDVNDFSFSAFYSCIVSCW